MLLPHDDKVLVKPLERDAVSAGGIHIPETAKRMKSRRGEVVSVGPGKMREDGGRMPMVYAKGDTLLFISHGGSEYRDKDGVDYLVLDQKEILGRVV